MFEATSQARINRASAMRTKTAIPGDVIFELGDIIEYHRPSTQKDVPGWHGPGTIIEIIVDQGQAVIRHKKKLRTSVLDFKMLGTSLV